MPDFSGNFPMALERGEASAIEAIETLLAEELTTRESRRIEHQGGSQADQATSMVLAGGQADAKDRPERTKRPSGTHKPQP